MTFYAKPINRPLALEGVFEKPIYRLFGHVKVKSGIKRVKGYNPSKMDNHRLSSNDFPKGRDVIEVHVFGECHVPCSLK